MVRVNTAAHGTANGIKSPFYAEKAATANSGNGKLTHNYRLMLYRVRLQDNVGVWRAASNSQMKGFGRPGQTSQTREANVQLRINVIPCPDVNIESVRSTEGA